MHDNYLGIEHFAFGLACSLVCMSPPCAPGSCLLNVCSSPTALECSLCSASAVVTASALTCPAWRAFGRLASVVMAFAYLMSWHLPSMFGIGTGLASDGPACQKHVVQNISRPVSPRYLIRCPEYCACPAEQHDVASIAV